MEGKATSAPAGAGHGQITDEAVAELRERIGAERPLKSQYHEYASPDAIRHFAHGIGDLNPLWTDPEHGAASRYGTNVAPPCFLCSCGMPRSVGLPGVHALYTGSSWRFERPVRVGERIHTSTQLAELSEKEGRYAGRQFLEVDEAIYRNEAGETLATLRSHCMRGERDRARSKGKYDDLQAAAYTPEEIEAIAAEVEAEEIRGGDPRYLETVAVCDELPQVVKGPLTVTDMNGWLLGWGGMFIRPHGIGHRWRRRHPAAYTLDARGVPDVPERVHWDTEFALRSGLPAPYDYGPQRIAWLSQVFTNWIGDDGHLAELDVEVRRLNLVGDTTWCRATVVDCRLEGDRGLVECSLRAENQRGEETAKGRALVQLPRRPG
jgi:acyl dehydratase